MNVNIRPYLREIKTYTTHRLTHKHSQKNPKKQVIQMSVSGLMCKQIVLYTQKKLLLSKRKKPIT